MRSNSRVLTTAGVIAGVILIGIVLGYLASRPPESETALPVEVSKPDETALARTNTETATAKTGATVNQGDHNAGAEALVANTNLIADWEDRIDVILGDDSETDEKAKKMLELLPNMPVTGQVETAGHISNLLPDEEYAKFGSMLTNASTSKELLDVIMFDAYNRPDSIKLPLMLEVARNPNHPLAAEAKDTLETFLDEDYGTDWQVWEEKMNEYLKENPD